MEAVLWTSFIIAFVIVLSHFLASLGPGSLFPDLEQDRDS